MSTIIDIPSCTALHLPTPNATALPLSTGELTVTVLPDQTLTLSIGTSSFPLTQRTKIQKVQTINQHPTYLFSPILPVSASGDASTAGERTIGQVKIVMKDSKSPGEWEATEALCKRFEEELKKHNVWDEKILFVNDEYELAGAGGEKSWGETFAGAIIGAGQAVAQKINTLTEGHVANTNPTHPPAPTDEQIGIAAVANARTASMAEAAENGATRLGNAIHEGGKKLGNQVPTAVHDKIHELNSGEKGELRKGLEEQWDNVKLVGQAIGDATLAVAGSASVNAHKAVEHNYGKAADKVAQDIGQTGANVGDTALSATKATSVIVQGANVSSGFGASTGFTEKTVQG